MSNILAFDRPMQSELREAQIRHLRRVIPPWQTALSLRTALDVGCGVGYFSALLDDLGFQVVAIDARAKNIVEARSRYPDIDFRVADVDDPDLSSLGTFDLVLSFGLLCHLENPMRSFRRLYTLTGKVLLIESMSVPVLDPFFIMLDEPPGEDQSLEAISCCPSQGAIIKMAYSAGFQNVYRFRDLPDHESYSCDKGRNQTRMMFAASLPHLDSTLIEATPEPSTSNDV